MSVVKEVKFETSPGVMCDGTHSNTMLPGDIMLSQVQAVEERLKIEYSEQIIETLTNEELQTAGDMFLYMKTCPKHDIEWFESWSTFYAYLFLTQPADHIILTLNRMMKAETSHDMDAKVRAAKLLKRASSLMSLNFEQIQSLQPKHKSRNGRAIKNSMLQNGVYSSHIS